MNKKFNFLWGILFILAAVMVIVNKAGLFVGINTISLLITVLLIPIILKSLVHLEFGGVFVPLAVLGIIYDHQLGIESFTPWPILIAAIFLSIGFSFIFPHHHHHNNDDGETVINEPDGSNVNIDTKFSGSVKYVNSNNLRSVDIDSSFAGTKVYFINADIDGDNLDIDFDLSFAGTELFIPKKWRIINNIDATMGGVEIKGEPSQLTEKTVTLKGRISLSGVTVIYV